MADPEAAGMQPPNEQLPTFWECVTVAASNPDLVANFDRLNGSNLSLSGSPLDLAIDQATGRLKADMQDFLNFVYGCVYLPLVKGCGERYEMDEKNYTRPAMDPAGK